jgi:hypothetical protein
VLVGNKTKDGVNNLKIDAFLKSNPYWLNNKKFKLK